MCGPQALKWRRLKSACLSLNLVIKSWTLGPIPKQLNCLMEKYLLPLRFFATIGHLIATLFVIPLVLQAPNDIQISSSTTASWSHKFHMIQTTRWREQLFNIINIEINFTFHSHAVDCECVDLLIACAVVLGIELCVICCELCRPLHGMVPIFFAMGKTLSSHCTLILHCGLCSMLIFIMPPLFAFVRQSIIQRLFSATYSSNQHHRRQHAHIHFR